MQLLIILLGVSAALSAPMAGPEQPNSNPSAEMGSPMPMASELIVSAQDNPEAMDMEMDKRFAYYPYVPAEKRFYYSPYAPADKRNDQAQVQVQPEIEPAELAKRSRDAKYTSDPVDKRFYYTSYGSEKRGDKRGLDSEEDKNESENENDKRFFYDAYPASVDKRFQYSYGSVGERRDGEEEPGLDKRFDYGY